MLKKELFISVIVMLLQGTAQGALQKQTLANFDKVMGEYADLAAQAAASHNPKNFDEKLRRKASDVGGVYNGLKTYEQMQALSTIGSMGYNPQTFGINLGAVAAVPIQKAPTQPHTRPMISARKTPSTYSKSESAVVAVPKMSRELKLIFDKIVALNKSIEGIKGKEYSSDQEMIDKLAPQIDEFRREQREIDSLMSQQPPTSPEVLAILKEPYSKIAREVFPLEIQLKEAMARIAYSKQQSTIVQPKENPLLIKLGKLKKELDDIKKQKEIFDPNFVKQIVTAADGLEKRRLLILKELRNPSSSSMDFKYAVEAIDKETAALRLTIVNEKQALVAKEKRKNLPVSKVPQKKRAPKPTSVKVAQTATQKSSKPATAQEYLAHAKGILDSVVGLEGLTIIIKDENKVKSFSPALAKQAFAKAKTIYYQAQGKVERKTKEENLATADWLSKTLFYVQKLLSEKFKNPLSIPLSQELYELLLTIR